MRRVPVLRIVLLPESSARTPDIPSAEIVHERPYRSNCPVNLEGVEPRSCLLCRRVKSGYYPPVEVVSPGVFALSLEPVCVRIRCVERIDVEQGIQSAHHRLPDQLLGELDGNPDGVCQEVQSRGIGSNSGKHIASVHDLHRGSDRFATILVNDVSVDQDGQEGRLVEQECPKCQLSVEPSSRLVLPLGYEINRPVC